MGSLLRRQAVEDMCDCSDSLDEYCEFDADPDIVCATETV
jgi:hypothetical protein